MNQGEPIKNAFKNCQPAASYGNFPSRPRWLLTFALFLLVVTSFPAQTANKEYEVKAVFLFNFAQFVDWPEGALPAGDTPFRIGILGDDPFGSALEETVRGESIGQHKFSIRHGRQVDDLKDCQIIFICRSERSHIGDILARLKHRPILTVSETEHFTQSGGMVNFFLVGSKVHFEINLTAARDGSLKPRSQLLRIAKVVEIPGDK